MPGPAPGGFCCTTQAGEDRTAIAVGKPPSPGLSRTDVLQLCLALDDAALSWLCDQLLRIRTSVYEQVYMTTMKPEALQAEETEPASMDLPTVLPSPNDIPPFADKLASEDQENNGKDQDEGADLDAPPNWVLQEQARSIRQQIRERDRQNYGEKPGTMLPTVQFESSMYYCMESEPTVEIGVVRIGDASQRSSVHFATKDLSAKAGVKYEALSGTIVFEAGEKLKLIEIVTINDSSWDSTLEFLVELSPEGLEHGFLGRYLWTTRVKILDDDAFPSNRFQDQIEALDFENLNKPILMWDFFRMNLKNKTVRSGVMKTLIADQVGNAYFILVLYLNLWMVDGVLCESCDRSVATSNLLLVMALRFLPFPLIHWMEYREQFWRVGGATRLTLQSNLLRKYLAYDAESLQAMDETKLILAMTRDAQELAKDAFGKLAPVITALTRLILLLIYQVAVPLARGTPWPSPFMTAVRFCPAAIFPIVMLLFLRLRSENTELHLEKAHLTQDSMVSHVRKVIANFELFRDYKRRGACVDQFEDRVRAYNIALADSNSIGINNGMFANWCTLVLILFWIFFGGRQVSDDKLEIGEFLNYLAIFEALGRMWGLVYQMLLSIQNCFDALENIVTYMNLPTENPHRMAQFQQNLSMCRKCKDDMAREGLVEDPCDAVGIELRDLAFAYKSSYKTAQGLASSLKASSVILPQGGLYTFVGPPSEGKGTILKLLGEVLIPTIEGYTRSSGIGSGAILIPAHLRSLHVSKDPMFVEGTLLANLTLGVGKQVGGAGVADGSKERALAICKRLGLSEDVMHTIAADNLVCPWREVLSSTECALLHLARALIANPEILCIHKPTLYLNNEYSDLLYSVLKDFVANRGLDMDAREFHKRRPRTCIVTARRAQGAGAAMADAVFNISKEKGLVPLGQVSRRHSQVPVSRV
eukprot:CAMPEP_0197622862 /NCGR_PEP_ID=MMETSP1338-20131121/2984_1 /TAXON_ID=43686 ORGANISM="Pelagodinium beii, Strain RCC1491" /NCGR_SAMPLE_ID=MMETSP1338 /ASSEMBLY_ACC=CAM_ASM_000754 /LENGTH=930 /DNA_ID=CAMNT_0043192633 /DNA_START=111 /DNA_END=2903 /DNA_ORIENTATION=+